MSTTQQEVEMTTAGATSEFADKTEEAQPELCLSDVQEQSSSSEEHTPMPSPLIPASTSNGTLSATTSIEDETKKSLKALAKAATEKTAPKSPVKGTARDMVDDILDSLAEVESHMSKFREYIKVQKGEDKPLYQWATYAGYSGLHSAVKELDKATAKFKRVRLPQDFISSSVTRANESSAAVSRAAAYALAVMNTKTASYMDDMETSTLSEEAKTQANAIITQELQKLMEHSTRATERVWVATDLLRTLKEKRGSYADWAWSAAGTVMTAGIAAVVAILVPHLYGPPGFDLVSTGGHGGQMNQVLDLVQRTQAVTNLTGELYTIKLQDIDERYKNLAALSESHGDRIDSIVDSLGPPNEEGVYYVSMPKSTNGESCKDVDGRIRKVSDDAARQLQRLQDEMQLMRKNVNRMDIRLSNGIDKLRKE